VITTERLTISRLSDKDAPFIYTLVNEPSFLRFIGDKQVSDKASALLYLHHGPLASYREFGYGLYRVSLTRSNITIGICGLVKREFLIHPDVGFAFLSQYCGKGYAYEAAVAVLEYEAKRNDLAVISAITDCDNQSSVNLLERLGFNKINGVQRPNCGVFEPAHYFERHFC